MRNLINTLITIAVLVILFCLFFGCRMPVFEGLEQKVTEDKNCGQYSVQQSCEENDCSWNMTTGQCSDNQIPVATGGGMEGEGTGLAPEAFSNF